MAAEELTEFLTAPGTPWYEVSNKGEDLGIIMNDELIRKYFAEHVVNPDAYCGPTMEISINSAEDRNSIWA